MVYTRRSICSVLLVSLAACAEPMFSDRGVDVTLGADRTLFYVGDTARITVTASNKGREAVTINSHGCPSHFQVILGRDSASMPGRQVCSLVAMSRELAPGESFALEYSWRLDDSSGSYLPAGEYRLRGLAYGVHLKAQSADVSVKIAARQ